MNKVVFGVMLMFYVSLLYSQTGGDNTYEFLNLPSGARVAAMGGNNVSHYDNDLNFVLNNPGLLRPEMHDKITLNYINYLSDINFGYVSYARNVSNVGTFAAGIQYVNYGTFLHASETGEIYGEFVPSEYSFNIAYAAPLTSKIQYGVNLKTVYSNYFQYFSTGLALDAGLSYVDTATLFSAGLVIKNAGIQIKTYTLGFREPLPFDIQMGVTKSLKHAPFRFSLTAHNLTNWNLRYTSVFDNSYELSAVPVADSTFGQKLTKTMNAVGRVGDELIRHIIIGVELVPHDNFYISLGYNYRRRSEMALETAPKLVGFSVGFGLKLSKFNISYGLASYHLGAVSNHFSLGINLGAFYKQEGL